MYRLKKSSLLKIVLMAFIWLCFGSPFAGATINGVSGPSFALIAETGHISTPEGGSIYVWGYAPAGGIMQYPGPTLIVEEGDIVTVDLTNNLDNAVSIIFPGQSNVITTGGTAGLVTREAAPGGGTVRYTFTATNPGTYIYHSGTDMELQIEMGLIGALIVRPHTPGRAYNHEDSEYDREILMLLSEMDPIVHQVVEGSCPLGPDMENYFPVYWFINGRCAPDTMAKANVSWLPHQPYNCMPVIHPGEKLLLRFICASKDLHPFHTHGNHMLVIARDGRLLESEPGEGADLAEQRFTLTVTPGGTADAIFTWTGKKLGWDIYGHDPEDPMETNEYAPDHGKPFPVELPDSKDLAFGTFYSGSPFLGGSGYLPPGQGVNNLDGGYFYMWHSHKEKEMVNNDVFPGGMMTMLMIKHPDVEIMD